MADPTSKKPDVKERRKHRRFGAMGPVDLTVQGEEPQEAYLAGIGRGGLGVYLHREVRPGQLVVLSLRLIEKGREGEALKIAARIRWVRPAGWFYMAGTFHNDCVWRYLRLPCPLCWWNHFKTNQI